MSKLNSLGQNVWGSRSELCLVYYSFFPVLALWFVRLIMSWKAAVAHIGSLLEGLAAWETRTKEKPVIDKCFWGPQN